MLLLRQKREGERSVNTGINHRGQSNTWVNERELLVTVMSRSSVNDEDTPVVLHTIHLSVTLISGVTDTCTTEILQVNTSFNSVWASETKHKNVRLLQLWESCRSSLWRLKRVFLLWGKLLNCLLNKVLGKWGGLLQVKNVSTQSKMCMCEMQNREIVPVCWHFFFANNLLEAFEPVSEASLSFWSSHN